MKCIFTIDSDWNGAQHIEKIVLFSCKTYVHEVALCAKITYN